MGKQRYESTPHLSLDSRKPKVMTLSWASALLVLALTFEVSRGVVLTQSPFVDDSFLLAQFSDPEEDSSIKLTEVNIKYTHLLHLEMTFVCLLRVPIGLGTTWRW